MKIRGNTVGTTMKPSKTLVKAAEEKNNQVLSKSTFSYGEDNTVGLRGYYYSAIDFKNNKITLSVEQGQGNEVIPTEHIEWANGDVVSIVNGTKYELCSTITAINGNVITLDKIPFTSIQADSNPNFDDWSICVPTKPDAGVADLGKSAVAFGDGNKASNWASTVMGRDNVVTSQYGTAAGRGNKVDGYGGFATGKNNKIAPNCHFANVTGMDNEVSGNAASAEGANNKATANYTHAGGCNTKATVPYQTVFGANNKEHPTALFVIGNGIKDDGTIDYGNPSNAFVVDSDGRAWVSGDTPDGLCKLVDILEFRQALSGKQNAIAAWPTKNLNDRYDAAWLDIPSGLYKIGDNIAGGPENVNINYGHLLNWRLGNTHSQIIIPIYKDSAGVWFRTGNNENWGDGWMPLSEPPMIIGVEYLTPERYNGKPVYKKIVNIGALPHSTEKSIAHGIASYEKCISYEVLAYDTTTTVVQQFPFVNTTGEMRGKVQVSAAHVLIYTFSNLGNYNAVATLRYTKK